MASGPIKRTKLVDLTLSITYFKEKVKSLSCIRLFATLWTVALQASPSMGFSQQEYWSGLPFPSPGDLSDPAVELGDLALQADCLPSEALIRYQGDVLSQRKACEDTGRRGLPASLKGGLMRNQLTPLFWTTSLYNLRRKVGCFSHAIWGI